jgi:hypothetical protein
MRHDPLDVTCPACEVDPGQPCGKFSLGVSEDEEWVHTRRVARVEEEFDDEPHGTWVVVGPATYGGAWGRGGSKKQALQEYLRNGGLRGRGYKVLSWNAGTVTAVRMHNSGNLTYHGPAPHIETVRPRRAR